MKRLLLLLFLTGAICIMQPVVIQAVDVINPVCQEVPAGEVPPAVCRDDATNSSENPIVGPSGVLTRAVSILSWVIGVFAVFAIIIAGIRFITSAGDSNTAASAQKAIYFALIGLAVAVMAQAIVAFVLSKL